MKDLKKWFEANYLDGDEVQNGQMMASSECLDALVNSRIHFLRSEIEKLEARQEEIKGSHIGIGGLYTAQVEMEVNQELTSIIIRYKEELKVLESK